MKLDLKRLFYFWLLCSCVLVQAKEITLAYGTEPSPPFQLGKGMEIADPPGLAIDIVQQAADKLDLKVRFQRLPNRRVLYELKLGKVDGAFMFSYRPERARFASYPMSGGKLDRNKRLGTIEYYLYSLKTNAIYWDGNKLQGGSGVLGANAGYSIVPVLKEHRLRVMEVPSISKLYQLLHHQRIVAFAAQENMMRAFMQQRNIQDVEAKGQAIKSNDYYLLFGHQFMQHSAEVAHAFWQQLQASREQLTPGYTDFPVGRVTSH